MPIFQPSSASSINYTTSSSFPYSMTTDGYFTFDIGDSSGSGYGKVVNLPSAAGLGIKVLTIYVLNSSSNQNGSVVLTRSGSDAITDLTISQTTLTIFPGTSITLISDGVSKWKIMDRGFRTTWGDGSTANGSFSCSQANSSMGAVNVCKVGELVFMSGYISVTGTFSGATTISFPTDYSTALTQYTSGSGNVIVGKALCYDTSAAISATADLVLNAGNTLYIKPSQNNTTVSYDRFVDTTNLIPFTWASGDSISFHGNWIVASTL